MHAQREAIPPGSTIAILGGGEMGRLIVCVGSLTAMKGHEYLIRAMPRVAAAVPEARLVIVGEGNQRARLVALVASLGISHAVQLAGYQEDVGALMKQADLCVQPSLHESFGLVLLEAMAASKAVVATDVEGIPEIVLDGSTGSLVPPKNPEAFAEAIISLLRDGARRRRMGAAGRVRVERHFDIRETVRSYQRLYDRVSAARLSDGSAQGRLDGISGW